MINASVCAEFFFTSKPSGEHWVLVWLQVVQGGAGCSCVTEATPHWGGHRTGVLGEILKLCFASEISSLFLFKELVVATFPKHQRWTVWFKITQVKTVPERCVTDHGNLFALSWIPAFCATLLLVSVFWSCLWNQNVCLQPQHQLVNSLELNFKIKHSKEDKVFVSFLYLLV